MNESAQVGIVMGSDSDLPTMQQAADICSEFDVPFELKVTSAHRTPDVMAQYGKDAVSRGLKVIIAGAGGAAHLPGMMASYTPLPVIGVPIQSRALNGMDSLLSIVQMPAGIPVATVSIGNGKNAGLLAMRILAASNESIRQAMEEYMQTMAEISMAKNDTLPREP